MIPALTTELADEHIFLRSHERQILLDLLNIAVNETLMAACILDRDTEARRGYNERITTLLTLVHKIEGIPMEQEFKPLAPGDS